MQAPNSDAITIYTTTWCGDCRRLKTELGRAGVSFKEIDLEREPWAVEYVLRVNNGNQSVPTVAFSDGTVMTEPSGRQVMDYVDLLTARTSTTS